MSFHATLETVSLPRGRSARSLTRASKWLVVPDRVNAVEPLKFALLHIIYLRSPTQCAEPFTDAVFLL